MTGRGKGGRFEVIFICYGDFNMDTFSTKDIYLASSLIAVGHTSYTIEKKDKIALFTFKPMDTPEETALGVDVDKYWQGNLSVDPKSLFNCFKELKNRIYE